MGAPYWYDPNRQVIYDPHVTKAQMRMWPHPPPYWWDPKENTYGYGPVSTSTQGR